MNCCYITIPYRMVWVVLRHSFKAIQRRLARRPGFARFFFARGLIHSTHNKTARSESSFFLQFCGSPLVVTIIISKVRLLTMAKEVAAVVAAAAESRGIGYQGQLVRVSGGRRCAAKEPARAGLVAGFYWPMFAFPSHFSSQPRI